jgi:hypothetical protein
MVSLIPNDVGITPDMWFWSICILFKFGRLPSSSGKEPVNWFPFRSLETQNITHRIRDKANVLQY